VGDDKARIPTAGNGTTTNGNGGTVKTPNNPVMTRERLISQLGATGAVLFDLVSERVDQRLEATSQDRAKAVAAVTVTFTRNLDDVSQRTGELERKLPAMQGGVTEAKDAARAAQSAASGAAGQASAAAESKVTELKALLSGDVPELVRDENGILVPGTVHPEPADFLGTLLSLVTKAVSLLAEVDGKIRGLEARLTGEKPAEPEKAETESSERADAAKDRLISAIDALAKVKELEKKLIGALKALGMEVEESNDVLPLAESMAQLEDGLGAASEALGISLKVDGEEPQQRLESIERNIGVVVAEVEKRGAAGKPAGEQ